MHHDQILTKVFISTILYITIQMLYRQLSLFLLNQLHQQLSIIRDFMLLIDSLLFIVPLLTSSLLNFMYQLLLHDQLLLLIHQLFLSMLHSHSSMHQHSQSLLFNLLAMLSTPNSQVIIPLTIVKFVFDFNLKHHQMFVIYLIDSMNLAIAFELLPFDF